MSSSLQIPTAANLASYQAAAVAKPNAGVDSAVRAIVLAADIAAAGPSPAKSYVEITAGDCVRAAADAAGYAAALLVSDAEADATRVQAFRQIWDLARSDAQALSEGNLLPDPSLWKVPPKWFQRANHATMADFADDPLKVWDFWRRWWNNALSGHMYPSPLIEHVALIPDDIWQQGAAAVAEEIRRIEAPVLGPADPLPAIESFPLYQTAHADFSFDTFSRLMRMVPFDEDIETIQGEAFDRLKSDIDLARKTLEDLVRAATASNRQATAELKVYANALIEEMARASLIQKLRVGLLIEYGANLDDFRGSEEAMFGLGPVLPKALARTNERLLDLLRTHFAKTLLRLQSSPLMKISASDDPFEVVTKLEQVLRDIERNDGTNIPALAPEDVAALKSLLHEARREAVRLSGATHPEAIAASREEFSRRVVRMAVDFGIYAWKGVGSVQKSIAGPDINVADAMMRRLLMSQSVSEMLHNLWTFLHHIL
ncbi:hypothetical protein NX862_15170 [Rhodobacter sp. KR11]|uniref:hypothetical protein n=1 Tax=Rhodobacter sp. KR11 TaxID=2974588 RepID=UPI002222AF2F|nr:hypothetical protein [Rhodobacter sp. KR11]MCW1920099.1 hypothetical protein [Rhodobacter sp. KR11]